MTATTIAAAAIITGYIATATSQTTARIDDEAARQVALLSESVSVVGTYACGSELCVDVLNYSGRDVGISYAYDGNGNAVSYRILNSGGALVAKMPVGSSTIALTPNTLSNATLISENFVVYRLS